MERAEQGKDAGVILTGHTLVGSVWLMQGRFAAAREAYERTIALYRPDRHRALVADYVTDRRVVARQLLAQALGALGYWDLARQHATEALAEARDLGHPATEAYALWLSMMLWQVIGEVDTVEAHAERLTALALELRADFWLGIATAYRGWVRAARGDATTAIPLIRDGITTFRASGGASRLTDYLTLLATAHRMAGEDAEALAVIGDAAAEARRTGEGRSLSEILRMRGEILVSMPTPDLAAGEASLRDAVHLARAQDARGWELRAATSLARLLFGRGERQQALDLLAPTYAWFSEGVDMPRPERGASTAQPAGLSTSLREDTAAALLRLGELSRLDRHGVHPPRRHRGPSRDGGQRRDRRRSSLRTRSVPTCASGTRSMPRLVGRFRLVRYDKRGHGLTDLTPGPYTIDGLADDLAGLCDGLGCRSRRLLRPVDRRDDRAAARHRPARPRPRAGPDGYRPQDRHRRYLAAADRGRPRRRHRRHRRGRARAVVRTGRSTPAARRSSQTGATCSCARPSKVISPAVRPSATPTSPRPPGASPCPACASSATPMARRRRASCANWPT